MSKTNENITEPESVEPLLSGMLEYIENATNLTLVETRKRNVINEKIAVLYEEFSTKAAKEAIKEADRLQALRLKQKFSALSFEEKEKLLALVENTTTENTNESANENTEVA